MQITDCWNKIEIQIPNKNRKNIVGIHKLEIQITNKIKKKIVGTNKVLNSLATL